MFQSSRIADTRLLAGVLAVCLTGPAHLHAQTPVDFNKEIRPFLSNLCFRCHGPDEAERQGELRLDTSTGAFADLGGHAAIVPGKPDESELVRRVTSTDPNEMMPPSSAGRRLTTREVELLRRWIAEGANYAIHWSYQPPRKTEPPLVPEVPQFSHTAIDRFIASKAKEHGLTPSTEADKATLIRRVSLDLTGLPPSEQAVAEFLSDTDEGAYERLVDRLLQQPAFGEHWARLWLDLARYADSSGYADDPLRTIWAYRDYVIRSFNANKPFDQFTIEQLAGDMLPDPTDDQLIATAFHRNTLTNNEGGTNDEEFRNVAVVDRVNTTFAVWMATTINCCQCHTHKYDPISQKEYYEVFAILNNTADADRGDDSPRLDLFSDEQKKNRSDWQTELASLDRELQTATPELRESLARWDRDFPRDLPWKTINPDAVSSQNGAEVTITDDQSVVVKKPPQKDITTVLLPVPPGPLSALRLNVLTDPSLPTQGPGYSGGNFVITRMTAAIIPRGESRHRGRYVRVVSPGKKRVLHLAEVQVISGADNIAPRGQASQSSTSYDGVASRGNDGNTNGKYFESNSVTHTAEEDDPWWEVDLLSEVSIDQVVIWNRTDGFGERFNNSRVMLLDEKRQPVWEQTIEKAAPLNGEYPVSTARDVKFTTAIADYSQPDFPAESVLTSQSDPAKGWAVGGALGKPHWLILVPERSLEIPAENQLQLVIEQTSKYDNHVLGKFQIEASSSPLAVEVARTPAKIRDILSIAVDARTAEQSAELQSWYFSNAAPELAQQRARKIELTTNLNSLKPATSVPIFRELTGEARRHTKIHHRGNFADQGEEVSEGVPAVFLSSGGSMPGNRLEMAQWLVSRTNPLTARVLVNRFWEQLFGQGIVTSSEEFGSQGELPTHPELLDWLAVEFMDLNWNMKEMLKTLVMTATYRQSSKVTDEALSLDPDNRWLSRGPRFRMSAEMIRDQSLALSGLLSTKMYGPPVRPPQPSLGLSAAFGGSTDWETSAGEDRYRRALYTQFRRSNPYPAMAAFDAPNREVCTLRRISTNTPLQALVTLNDPVHLEAAQALARQVVTWEGTPEDRARHLFRHCTSREPVSEELQRLVALQNMARSQLAGNSTAAEQLASNPLGPVPAGQDATELAAWTIVGNVILNLDEMLMKR